MLKSVVFSVLLALAVSRSRVTRNAKSELQAYLDEGAKLANQGKLIDMIKSQWTNDVARYVAPDGKLYEGVDDIVDHMKHVGVVSEFSHRIDDVYSDGNYHFAIGLVQFKKTIDGRTKQWKDRTCVTLLPLDLRPVDPSASRKIQAVYDAMRQSLKNRDVEGAVDAGFLEDAKFVTPDGGVVSGRAVIKQHAKLQPFKDIKDVSDRVVVFGDSVVEIGRTTMTYSTAEGADGTKEFRHIVLWKKSGESYKQAVRGLIEIKQRG